jgi:hypothetical protein
MADIDHYIVANDGGLKIIWRRAEEGGQWRASVFSPLDEEGGWGTLKAWDCASLQSVMRRMIKFYDNRDPYEHVGKNFVWRRRADGQLTGWKILRRVGRWENGAPLYLVRRRAQFNEIMVRFDYDLCSHDLMVNIGQ